MYEVRHRKFVYVVVSRPGFPQRYHYKFEGEPFSAEFSGEERLRMQKTSSAPEQLETPVDSG